MSATSIINYTPPPTVRAFIKDHRMGELFYDWIVGPVGSGKTTGLFFKLVYMAKLQAPSPDGIRRTRAVIVRNTMPQLKDTTLVSWAYWFKDGQAGSWDATNKIFTLRFSDVECIVLFRPLDTPDDISRVLSLEINFAIIDEFVEIPKAIVDALSARLGRYRQPDGTPVSIWGMWGSSNPSTEDNWWYDFLQGDGVLKHHLDPDVQRARNTLLDVETTNATYFHQPSGFAPDAENLENLPGGRGYYLNAAKNKSDTWVKQFIDAEWGFSIAGQPVVNGFREDIHVAKRPLKFDPYKPLVIGLDPGIKGSALVMGQEDYDGRLSIFDELIQQGYGARRIIDERLMPLLRNKYPNAKLVFAPDPASANRTQTDESTVVKVIREQFGRDSVAIESNNRLPLRIDALSYFINRLVDGSPALQIDPSCKMVIRALKGGWRWAADSKKDILKGSEPDKNEYSHPGDATGYLARYFHRGAQRVEKYGRAAVRPHTLGGIERNNYNFR